MYGVSFPDTKQMKTYLTNVAEAKKRDHRLVGAKQELFFFHDLSPGSCFFLPHGARVYNRLQEHIRQCCACDAIRPRSLARTPHYARSPLTDAPRAPPLPTPRAQTARAVSTRS